VFAISLARIKISTYFVKQFFNLANRTEMGRKSDYASAPRRQRQQ